MAPVLLLARRGFLDASARPFARATAAITRSSILGDRVSGHCDTAWLVIPTALAIPVTEFLNMDSASPLVMDGILSIIERLKSRGLGVHQGKLPLVDTLAKRIYARRVSLGEKVHNQAWLARQVKRSPQAVNQWERGGTLTLKGPSVILAARALQTTEDWLQSGHDPRCDAQGNIKRRGPQAVPEAPSYPEDVLEILNALQALPVSLRRYIVEIVIRLAPWDGENDRRGTPP